MEHCDRDNTDMMLDRESSVPLGKQLETIMRRKISTGVWAPNTRIPSENELCKICGISRMTARNVVSQFVSYGYFYRIQGKGTFVSEKKYEFSSLQYSGLRKQLEEQGHSVSTKLISCDVMPADEFLADKLNISVGEQVFKVKRVRAANGINISYHKSYVPVKLCPGLEKKDLTNEQLCKIMATDYYLERQYVVETLETFVADRSKAKYLNVKPGMPLLLLQDQLYTPDNRIYEFSIIFFRGDKIKMHIEFHG